MDRTFYLSAETETEKTDWMECISMMVAMHQSSSSLQGTPASSPMSSLDSLPSIKKILLEETISTPSSTPSEDIPLRNTILASPILTPCQEDPLSTLLQETDSSSDTSSITASEEMSTS
jgi:hypothetical protein